MSFNDLLNVVLPIIVLIAFGIAAYAVIKRISFTEAWHEILDKIKGT